MLRSRNPAWFLLPGLVAVAYLALLTRNLAAPDTPPPWPQFSFVDFRDTVWVPARDLFSGHDPYHVREYLTRHPAQQAFPLYHPAVLTLGAPIAVLPLPVAAGAWAVVLGLALSVLFRAAAAVARVPARSAWVALAATFVMVSAVGRQPLSAGQVAVVTAAAAVYALSVPAGPDAARARTGGPGVLALTVSPAVVAVALGMLKPQVALPLLALLVVTGRTGRAVRGAVLSVLVGLPVLLTAVVREGGPGGFLQVVRDSAAASSVSPWTMASRPGSSRIDAVGSLARLLGHEPSAGVTAALTLVVALGTLVAVRICWTAHRARPDADAPRLAYWSACAAALVLSMPNELYGALVAVPAVLLAARMLAAHGLGALRPALPGLVLLVPFVHVHKVDALLGLDQVLQPLNGVAFAAAAVLAVMTARASGSDGDPLVLPQDDAVAAPSASSRSGVG